MNLEYLRRMHIGFSIAVGVNQLAPCFCFDQSGNIDDRYKNYPKTEHFPNPWHIGVMDPFLYPDPGELLQGELELLLFMFSMVLELKPKLIVETGTNIGLMARALGSGCWVNGFGRVVTCDIDVRMVDYARKLCEGLPVDVQHKPALELEELREADLVFIDSAEESRVHEVSRVKPGAVFVVHDTYAEPYLRESFATEAHRVHLDGPRGFSIVRKM